RHHGRPRERAGRRRSARAARTARRACAGPLRAHPRPSAGGRRRGRPRRSQPCAGALVPRGLRFERPAASPDLGVAVSVIVQKYGGTSVADADRIRAVADRATDAKRAGHDVVVVVSAMGDTTDELMAMARSLAPT